MKYNLLALLVSSLWSLMIYGALEFRFARESLDHGNGIIHNYWQFWPLLTLLVFYLILALGVKKAPLALYVIPAVGLIYYALITVFSLCNESAHKSFSALNLAGFPYRLLMIILVFSVVVFMD